MGWRVVDRSSVGVSHTGSLAERLFSPIAADYDRQAQILCLGQYRRWHRFLLSRVREGLSPGPARVLDMATGTGLLAAHLTMVPGVEVVAADVTEPMLRNALNRGVVPCLVRCTAEAPPFADASFDAVIFAYLLRYVSDVPAALSSLARLLRPGGHMASLDFAVPPGVAYPLWRLYVDLVLPVAGHAISAGWGDVGSFLGPSIRAFYRYHPVPSLLDAWRRCGFSDVQARRLSLGGGIVLWGRKLS